MKEGDKVSLIVGKESPLGYAVLIDEEFEGLLYKNEVFQTITEGMLLTGYIKKLREDGKIDVSLSPQGFKKNIEVNTATILKYLEVNKGVLSLSDKSTPEEIKGVLHMSKKNFKKAIGSLYKQKRIIITDTAIYLQNNKG